MKIGAGKRRFPEARSDGLLMEEVDSEKVIFDEESNQAHCLTPLASVVFDHCDGRTASAELARIASAKMDEPISEEHVQMALAQLEERGLLSSPLAITYSRREMVRKSAAVGAATATATLIFTVEPAIASFDCITTHPTCSHNAQCGGGTGCPSEEPCCCDTRPGIHFCQCSDFCTP